MKKDLLTGIVGGLLMTAGAYVVGCQLYEKGMNNILNDIKDSGLRVVDEDGDEYNCNIMKKTLFGEKVVGKL